MLKQNNFFVWVHELKNKLFIPISMGNMRKLIMSA